MSDFIPIKRTEKNPDGEDIVVFGKCSEDALPHYESKGYERANEAEAEVYAKRDAGIGSGDASSFQLTEPELQEAVSAVETPVEQPTDESGDTSTPDEQTDEQKAASALAASGAPSDPKTVDSVTSLANAGGPTDTSTAGDDADSQSDPTARSGRRQR